MRRRIKPARSVCCTLLFVTLLTTQAQADDKNPCQVVEAYVAAILRGDAKEAARHAKGPPARPKRIADFKKQLKLEMLRIETVYVGQGKTESAIAISQLIKPRRGREQRILFTLSKDKEGWHIHDLDMENEKSLPREIERFLQKHPRAKKIP